jgi:hypothetical protein
VNRRIVLVFVAGVVVLGVASALVLRERPVAVVVPQPSGDAARACDDLHGRLPATVAGQGHRSVTPESTRTAAWGGAAIVLRCGVGTPAALQPTSDLTTIDGVDWLQETADGATRWTTVGRVAYVEVTIPDSYDPPSDALVDLGPAIRAADPALATSG